jgi:peptidoglycan/xylan/chitin deacetylase (PgdA/CDA1 family)
VRALIQHVQKRLINLTFHGIGDPGRSLDRGEADVWVGRHRFETVLDAVTGRDDVRITFDDGNASDVELGLPALVQRGLSATFFVVAGRLGAPGFVDAVQVRELAAAGMGIGSHGLRHRPWRGLDDGALDEELTDARRLLEDVLGRPVIEAACPFGAYDRRSVAALRRSGYRAVYTSDRGTARAGEWMQARNTVTATGDGDVVAQATAHDARIHQAVRGRATRLVKRWR